MDSSLTRRNLAAAGLVTSAVLAAVSVATQPALDGDATSRLAAIHAGGTVAATSAALFVLAQLPMLVGLLGVAHLLREARPRASLAGAMLGVLGCFGHAVYGGVMLSYVVMAGSPGTSYASLVDRIESSPVMAFAAMGLLGLVLGTLVLSIALFRSRVVPRWIPVTLWVWLVVEFVGSNLSDYAMLASGLCVVLAFGGLARELVRTPAEDWTPVSATAREREQLPAGAL